MISGLVLPILLMTVLIIVPAASPATGAATADFLRSIFGPQPVAQLESISYWMRDAVNRSMAAITILGPQVSWANIVPGNPQIVPTTPTCAPTTQPDDAPPLVNTAGAPILSPTAIVEQPSSTPTPDVVMSPPHIGWQPYTPNMARTIVMVDPARSYAGVALVRMDLSRLQLHIMAGFIEPAHPSGIDEIIPDLGMVPIQDQGSLVAAFNGGFKAVHGHYGMMVNGTTLLEPVDNMATVAVYRDGSVRMGAWGRDLLPSADVVALRQNCPLLVDAGQINPALSTDGRRSWVFTNNSDVTWRTGLGLTDDGRYLIYAVGNGTTAQFLAEALQRAGADMGMQLDINQYYAHFVVYSNMNTTASSPGSELMAEPLLDKMIDTPKLYLMPSPRDFFYLTARE